MIVTSGMLWKKKSMEDNMNIEKEIKKQREDIEKIKAEMIKRGYPVEPDEPELPEGVKEGELCKCWNDDYRKGEYNIRVFDEVNTEYEAPYKAKGGLWYQHIAPLDTPAKCGLYARRMEKVVFVYENIEDRHLIVTNYDNFKKLFGIDIKEGQCVEF